MNIPITKRGFTIIELLVVVTIISILVTVATVQYHAIQVHSRDANRRDSLSAYRVAFEQYKSVSGYYVLDSNAKAYDSQSVPALVTVGYSNLGWGRLTRKAAVGGLNYAKYPSASIADALQQHGYLSAVRTDPLLTNFTTDLDSGGGAPSTQDFYFVACGVTSTGVTNAAPSGGTEYTIYAKLEQPTKLDISQAAIGRRCTAPSGDVPTDVAHFNYAVGSVTF
jgi:prepilin-type N-terminal cleavage/methylation domain-containing protein